MYGKTLLEIKLELDVGELDVKKFEEEALIDGR
jgi:hypothetical protein